MLHVGYITPYRIVLLILIKQFCEYSIHDELLPKLAVFITKSILNQDHSKCTEPTQRDILMEMQSWSTDRDLIEPTLRAFSDMLHSLDTPHILDEFIQELKSVFESEHQDKVTLDRNSVLGLFVRRCRIEYQQLAFDRLQDIFEAYQEYIQGMAGDADFTPSGPDVRSKGWLSDYNMNEFLKFQAEKIERTGTTDIHPTVLHAYLEKMERQMPSITAIYHLRYLNYTRTKEYIQSLSYLHFSFDMSLNKGIDVQYALLNLGIVEYKFGHLFNALSALNDALLAAKTNKDEAFLQQVQFWIEVCRKNHPFNEPSSYTDNYLDNLKTLTRARDHLRNGDPCRSVFQLLCKSQIRITMENIQHMDRVQFLTTHLAWQRYGNSVLGKTYLDLASHTTADDSIEDIEKTVIAEANMFQASGSPEQAIQVIDRFASRYQDEGDFLKGWRQARARIIRQFNKRRLDMMEHQADILQFSLPPDSEAYLNAWHDNAYQLMLRKEFERALLILDQVHDYMRKTDKKSQLGNNLILQATIHIQMGSMHTAIPILTDAMRIAKQSNDVKNYYSATIKLGETYARLRDTALIERAVYMLESIFPKVLLMKAKQIESDLYLAYAMVLDASSEFQEHRVILEYIEKAQEGYFELRRKYDLLKVLHFKAIILDKLKLTTKKLEVLSMVRNLQELP